jgi:DNA polymerase III alpha subunit/nucleotidyltransferase/DNA polymerase involved in DNA repair
VAKSIIHVDADAFFASVEQAADPRLRGRPIAVGGEKRGVIASASYEAREFGITAAMPSAQAKKLCPRLVLLPGDFEKYEQFSRWMFSYAYDFTPDVEISSIDAGYLDLSGCRHAPRRVADTVRKAIYQALKISVSEGIGSSKLVSQIASKLRKPRALVQVEPGEEKQFLHPLPNRWLPGIGHHTAVRMNAAGLTHIGQIAATPVDCLALLVGSRAPLLHEFANGVDERPVTPATAAAKSYGSQHTFDEDVIDEALVDATLRRMADRLTAAARGDGRMIRTVTVKVRYNDMSEQQRSESLAEPTDLETDLYGRLRALLRRAWERRISLRMVSLKLSNLYAAYPRAELALEGPTRTYDARHRLANVVQELRHSYGNKAVMRGHDMLLTPTAKPCKNPEGSRPKSKIKNQKSKISSPFVPLRVHSYYSFLDSLLSPEDIVALAVKYECPAVAMTDAGNLHGAVRFAQAAQAAGIRPVIGAEIEVDRTTVLLYARDHKGYTNLCRILSGQGPGKPVRLTLRDFRFDTEGLIAVTAHATLAPHFPDAFYPAVALPPRATTVPPSNTVATPAIRYAAAGDHKDFEIIQSIRTLTLLNQSHPEKRRGAYGFPDPQSLRERFKDHPEMINLTQEIAGRCDFSFEFGKMQIPPFRAPRGMTAHGFLRELVLRGVRDRYGAGHARLLPQIEEELGMIEEVGYEEYFLVVWELLQACRGRGIEWITRGSAADSLVCYCLGISDVCPIRFELDFRRFLNRERMQLNKLPDIDIDFAHDRKDDVVDLMFKKYGSEHTATVGGFSTYQSRSALGDVAKVLGVSEYQVRRVTTMIPHLRARDLEDARNHVQCGDVPFDEEPFATAFRLARKLDGVPRNPKMHPCGVVLSRDPMAHLTPTFISAKQYPTTHLDMGAAEDIGLVKIDILAQGGLAVLRDARAMLRERGIKIDLKTCAVRDAEDGERGTDFEPRRARSFREQRDVWMQEHWTLKANPATPRTSQKLRALRELRGSESPAPRTQFSDPLIWDLICSGQARAVHHIESPAMISLCRMCNVRDIDTLIAIVSVIRPGAANEKKKQRFTRRYQGIEPVTYPHPSLASCLRTTFGMIVYEEQVLQVCDAFTAMSPGDADRLRRALNKRDWDKVRESGKLFWKSARACSHTEEEIKEVWLFLCGFNGFSFCKAHSTAYGVEAYQSAWMKTYFPAEFMAAVLTNGKGFYSPLVYVLECLRLGIRMLPPCVDDPGPGYRARNGNRIRVPLSSIKGLTAQVPLRALRERRRGPFTSLRDFLRRVHPTREESELLLRAGAFDPFAEKIAPDRVCRTPLFWDIQWLAGAYAPGQDSLLADTPDHPKPPGSRTEPTRLERLNAESELLGFTASGHPLDRHPDIAWETYCPVAELNQHLGKEVTCCGLIVIDRVVYHDDREQMKFITLADRTGLVETQMFKNTYKKFGLATVRYPVLEVTATVEPFDNENGFTLNIHRAGEPRKRMNEFEQKATKKTKEEDGVRQRANGASSS